MEKELEIIISSLAEIKIRLKAIEERLTKIEAAEGSLKPLGSYFTREKTKSLITVIPRKIPRIAKVNIRGKIGGSLRGLRNR
jgi:hypothetical protein